MPTRYKALIILTLTCLSTACAKERTFERARPDSATPRILFATSSDPDCKSTALNLLDNRGLWGDKASFRETLSEKDWKEFEEMSRHYGLTESCRLYVLEVAAKPHTSGPLPLNLITLAVRFHLAKKSQ